MSNKNYRKYAVSTMTAAAAVAAVAPAVSAASFSDVSKDTVPNHYDAIMALADQEIVIGRQDGTFAPWENVQRAQVAAMFTRAMDLSTPDNVSEVLKDYSDVSIDNLNEETANAIAAVTEEGIFHGENGVFGAWEPLYRSQMASVLVRAYDLEKYDTGEDVDVNLPEWVKDETAADIQTVVNLGISTEADNFRPGEKISRAAFSSMLNRTLEYVEQAAPAVESVSGSVNDDDTVTVTGNASNLENVTVHLYKGEMDKTPDFELTAPVAEDGSYTVTSEELEAGKYSVHAQAPNDATIAQKTQFTVEAPAVESVSAINATTIEVTFEDGNVVEVELDEALVDGDNEVTFVVGDNEYTVTVTFDADAAAVAEATTAVEIAENSLLQEDLNDAQAIVDELTASDEKVLLNARLAVVQNDIDDVIEAVNDATGELSLYRAINVVPFENVMEDYISDYQTAIDAGSPFNSTSDIQDVIDQVNADQLDANITAAKDAVVTVNDLDVTSTDEDTFSDEVEAAQSAIHALPSDYTMEDEDTPVVEQLQAELDSLVVRYNNYVNIVEPVVNPSSQVDLYNELVANFDNVVEANISDYDFSNMTTIDEVQYEVNFVNTKNTINDFVVDADTTQSDIDELEALVPMTGAEDADGNPTATVAEQGLLDTVDGYQDAFDTLTGATSDLADAVAEAEAAQTAYVAAGGDEEATVYTDVTADLDAVDDVDMDDSTAITTATSDLTTTTTALEAQTETMVALEETIDDAKAAQEAYLAAGGDEEDVDYKAVTTALNATPLDATDIENATATLEADTDELVLVSSVNEAVTATELQPQLVKLNQAEYNNMSATQRLEVADLFLETHADTDYTDSAVIATDLVAVIGDNTDGTETGYYELLADVNNASTISETDKALEALDVDEYDALTAAEQLVVAENVLNNKDSEAIDGAYSSITQIVNNF